MIVRRFFANALAAALFGLSLACRAQPADKVWRVGFLAGGARLPNGAPPAALRAALQALGYTEPTNIVYVGRWAEGRNERLPALAAELVDLKVDAIVTTGGPSAAAAKRASATVPVVVVYAGDVVETGLVASLGHPGGNVTGIDDPASVLSGKRLELLKELLPGARRIAVLWNAGDDAMTLRYRSIEKAAQALGLTIEPLGVREPDDFNDALASMNRDRPDALMMVSDALTSLNRQRVLDYAAARQIPSVYEFVTEVRAGGLMSYGSDMGESMGLAAGYLSRIFKGAKPSDLPVEQPNRYFLAINMKTAGTLGLAVPPLLLVRADEVIR
ncbi:MAG TPA: ABC transporter substrate-binding protein [Variovorax sp.]